jgi:hypothetical protein
LAKLWERIIVLALEVCTNIDNIKNIKKTGLSSDFIGSRFLGMGSTSERMGTNPPREGISMGFLAE